MSEAAFFFGCLVGAALGAGALLVLKRDDRDEAYQDGIRYGRSHERMSQLHDCAKAADSETMWRN